MICEYYHNQYEHDLEDGYIKANLGGCVHAAFSKSERLSRLKEGDILVVANAATLSSDPVNLLWMVNHLSHRGVQIHFVEEDVVIRGNACDQTSHVIENILSLLGDIPSSCRQDRENKSCMVEQEGSGRHEPFGRGMVWDAGVVSEREHVSGSNLPTHPTAREHSRRQKINRNHLETSND